MKLPRGLVGTIAVTALLLSGCSAASSSAQASDTGTLARIKTAGFIAIGTSNDVPFSFMEGNSTTLQGIDAEMMQYVADKMGVKINVYVTDWNSLIPSLQAKKFDIVVDAMWITDARKKIVTFTDPWYSEGEGIVVRKSDTSINSLDDLKNKTIGVQQGSTMVPWVQAIAGSTVKLYDSQALGLLDLNASRVDALITDSASAAYVIQKDPTLTLRLVTPYTPHFAGTIGAAIRQEDADLLAAVNASLAAMKAEGKDLAVLKKWGLGADNLVH